MAVRLHTAAPELALPRRRQQWYLLLLLLACSGGDDGFVRRVGAGPPYLFVDGRPLNFKAALFGGILEVHACTAHFAQPRLANAPLSNGAELAGRLALIDRDGPEVGPAERLSFVDKALRAQAAGAAVAVMINYNEEMVRPADTNRKGGAVKLLVIGVSKSVGQQLLRALRVDLLYDVDDRPLPGQHGGVVGCRVSAADEMVQLSWELYIIYFG